MPSTRRTTRSHRSTRPISAERLAVFSLIAAAGVAVSITAAAALARQEGKKEATPPATQPATPPAADPSQVDKDAAQQLMDRIREEAAKQGMNTAPPTTPPAVPVVTPPATPATPPPGGKPAPGASEKDPAAAPGGKSIQPQPAAPEKGTRSDPKNPRSNRPQPPTRPPGAAGAQKPTPQPAAPLNIPGMQPPPGMPAAPGAAEPVSLPDPGGAISDDGQSFVFNFTDATDLTLIVQFVQQALDLQIIALDSGLVGQKVVLMTPVTVPIDQVIPFLTFLLEQKGYTIIKDSRGIFIITPANAIFPTSGDDRNNSTQVIPVPGMKPTSIQGPITAIINSSRGAAGGAASQPMFLDDLGVIIITDSPNVIENVRQMVTRLVTAQKELSITRYPITNIAASAARDRVIELLGSGIISRPVGGAAGANPAAAAASAAGSLSNIPERLSLDSSTNALLFRGRPDEGTLLNTLIRLVDVPNAMESIWYPIGARASETVVDMARREQLGEVTTFQSSEGGASGAAPGIVRARTGVQPGQIGGAQGQGDLTGAGFVVYPDSGGFIYRGTTQQHARVAQLIKELGPLSEFNDDISYEFIRLRHSKAVDVAQTVQDLISGQASGNRGALLGRDLGTRNRREPTATERTRENERRAAGEPDPKAPAATGAAAAGGEVLSDLSEEDVLVIADEPNNQVVVKAPVRLQRQLRTLIDRLDLRRPQVHVEAQVVAVTTGENFNLTVEIQQIIGQFALSTNFGLSTLDPFTAAKEVATDLPGMTAALIRSKDVPFIINAIQSNTDSRIMAAPQVLVDDNEEAVVEVLDQQPTLTTTIGNDNQNNTQSFGGFEPAGPRLTVRPQISDGGYLRLEYEVELSAFTGESSVAGVPPPKQENRVRADSVTVPSDTTIVVGGLNFEQRNDVDTGIPILKDIPLLGYLFKDKSVNSRNITLYVFITPKIMRDPSFADLRLLTRQPLRVARLDPEFPAPEHERIDVLDTAVTDTARREEEEIFRQKEKYEPKTPDLKKKKYRRRDDNWLLD